MTGAHALTHRCDVMESRSCVSTLQLVSLPAPHVQRFRMRDINHGQNFGVDFEVGFSAAARPDASPAFVRQHGKSELFSNEGFPIPALIVKYSILLVRDEDRATVFLIT